MLLLVHFLMHPYHSLNDTLHDTLHLQVLHVSSQPVRKTVSTLAGAKLAFNSSIFYEIPLEVMHIFLALQVSLSTTYTCMSLVASS